MHPSGKQNVTVAIGHFNTASGHVQEDPELNLSLTACLHLTQVKFSVHLILVSFFSPSLQFEALHPISFGNLDCNADAMDLSIVYSAVPVKRVLHSRGPRSLTASTTLAFNECGSAKRMPPSLMHSNSP